MMAGKLIFSNAPLVAALSFGLLAAQPAGAVVAYELHSAAVDFVYFAPTFLGANLDTPASGLVRCTSSIVTCSGVTFYRDSDGLTNGDLYDAIGLHYDDGNATAFYYFANGAFQTPGAYVDDSSPTTLTVVDIPAYPRMKYLFSGPVGTFELGAAGPLTGVVDASAAQAHCASAVVVCHDVTLFGDSDGLTTGDLYDAVAFRYDDGSASAFYYFPNLAFQVPGTYGDVNNPMTTITVVADIPEPGSWALMLLGLGLSGSILRRRRAAATS